jgi:hypothetical protein
MQVTHGQGWVVPLSGAAVLPTAGRGASSERSQARRMRGARPHARVAPRCLPSYSSLRLIDDVMFPCGPFRLRIEAYAGSLAALAVKRGLVWRHTV